jgi:hypothetical protein
MDRQEKPRSARPSEFNNADEINESDAALLESPTGREDHRGLTESSRVAGSEIKKPIGARPRSEVTGRHDEGSDANETTDGLNSSEEALRQAAEDTPNGRAPQNENDMPVFDRGDALPKI